MLQLLLQTRVEGLFSYKSAKALKAFKVQGPFPKSMGASTVVNHSERRASTGFTEEARRAGR